LSLSLEERGRRGAVFIIARTTSRGGGNRRFIKELTQRIPYDEDIARLQGTISLVSPV